MIFVIILITAFVFIVMTNQSESMAVDPWADPMPEFLKNMTHEERMENQNNRFKSADALLEKAFQKTTHEPKDCEMIKENFKK